MVLLKTVVPLYSAVTVAVIRIKQRTNLKPARVLRV